MRKHFRILAFFAIVALFAGCGGGAGQTESPANTGGTDNAPSATSAAAPAAQGDAEAEDIAIETDWRTADHSGKTVKFIDGEALTFSLKGINWGYPYYMAILEWQHNTGATMLMLPALEIPAVLAGINANEGYDFVQSGAYWPMNNLLMTFDDDYDYFVNRYGTKINSQMGMNIYDGHFIGPSYPWNFGAHAMLYNLELLNRLGVETPRELFMRGEWTWDAYWEMVKYVGQLDMDGDGTPDYVATANAPHFRYMVEVMRELSDGTYENIADTQRLRDFADMIYTGYNILEIYQEEMPQPWMGYSFGSEKYPWISSVGIPSYDPTVFFGFKDNIGEFLEWVPMPAYGDDNEFNGGGRGLYILKGAGNPDAALNFLDFVINAVGDTSMQMVTQGRIDYGFVGMTGCVPESAEYLEYWANYIDNAYDTFTKYPHYSWEYYEACLDYWNALPIIQGGYHGWRSSLYDIPNHRVFVDYPPSTAVSMYIEQLQALIDDHNEFIKTR
ncbi:MAG: hypothetical protein FWF03_02800 [Defluviitaleaceae bacterium]|nr:hypothetical protein [Defluviitaleaceae bacterium]